MKAAFAALTVLTLAVLSCWATGYEDLTRLVKAGVTDDVIIAFINTSNANYALSADNIVQLKAMGASNGVIVAALQHKKAPVEQAPLPAAAPPEQDAVGQPTLAPPVDADPYLLDQPVPSSGEWVYLDDSWYWQYPTGVIVDLGWGYPHGYGAFGRSTAHRDYAPSSRNSSHRDYVSTQGNESHRDHGSSDRQEDQSFRGRR